MTLQRQRKSPRLKGYDYAQAGAYFVTVCVLDYSVVMPNHMHGVVLLSGGCSALPCVMQWFKIMTTNAYMRAVEVQGWLPFEGRLWQRSYYDHIIRNEADLNRIRDYVATNPARWTADTFWNG